VSAVDTTRALEPTHLVLDADDVVADVDPRVFGGLLEHMGRCVYEGVFEPGSRHADGAGCRTDVLEALARLDMTAVRYPGGNFVSGYDWRDGVGPVEHRPARVERAWRCIEPNTFGTDEFLRLCQRMGWTPMMAVNLGTGSPYDAQDLIAYTNAPAGTLLGDRREANGHASPYGVDLWCLGNEMDGIWQLGHTTASEYARRAREAARLMREVDPGIEVVACGSSDPNLPSHPRWSTTVLDEFGDGLDYLSLHRYARNPFRRSADFLGFGLAVDRQIEEADQLCRAAQRRHGHESPARISFDEWNVWYRTAAQTAARMLLPARLGGRAPHLIEEVFALEDALVCAGFLNSFLRHADVVRIANIAQMVNVIAPLITKGDRLLVQSSYHTFRMFSSRRRGDALRVSARGPRYPTRRFGDVPVLDTSAVLGPDGLHVFAVNRSLERPAPLELELAGIALTGEVGAEVLTGPHPRARNTFEDPEVVVARPFEGASASGTSVEMVLPACSLVAATFTTTDRPARRPERPPTGG
jgi:alpha-N-arabinofuranosidase